MSNRLLTFITVLNLIISLTALWVASPLASTTTLRDKIAEIFNETPELLYEMAVKGGEVSRQKQEEKTQQAQQEQLSKIWSNLTASYSPFSGNENGNITIVSFFDYSCGYCQKAHEVVEQLIKEDPALKVIYKPVALFSDPLIIKSVLAAHKQGKYKEMHDALMSNQVDPTKDAVKGLAKKLGLDVPKFLEDLESEEVKKQAAENQAMMKQLRLAGTPTYIIEQNAIIPGHMELDEFKNLLQSIKAEKAKAADTTKAS